MADPSCQSVNVEKEMQNWLSGAGDRQGGRAGRQRRQLEAARVRSQSPEPDDPEA